MKRPEALFEGRETIEPPLDGPALGVKRYHSLAAEAPTEARQLERETQLEQRREVYLRLLTEHLELAERLVTASQEVLDQQRASLEQRDVKGQPSETSRMLLETIEQTHQSLTARRDALRRELSH
jgi:hypothetical protein